jgi:hypothetical protein
VGGGSWDPGTYQATTRSKIQTGQTFGYTTQTQSAPVSSWAAHEDLDPLKVNGPASPLAGQNIRESRDSDEHPTSTPLAVLFDVTGSMGVVPRTLQTKLTELFGLILRKGYLEHPQVLTGAYGDARCDYVPLQVSQFESDNRIDDALDKVFLEGNGGGNGGESQVLAWYYIATHTATDAWEKRQKKGYAFFIGDEWTHDITTEQIKRLVGDGEPLLEDLSLKGIAKALLEKWEAYVFVIDNLSAKGQRSVERYTEIFGKDRVLVVEDENAIAETIALAVGITEGVIDLDDGVDDLKSVGASDDAIRQATKALSLHKDRTSVVVADKAPKDLDTTDDDSVARL